MADIFQGIATRFLRSLLVLFLTGLVAAGCYEQPDLGELASAPEASFAKEYIALFQRGDFESLAANTEIDLPDDQLLAQFVQIANIIPKENPVSVELVKARTKQYPGGGATFDLSLQYQFPDFPDTWVLASIFIQRHLGDLKVKDFQFELLPNSLAEVNAFPGSSKPFASYVILVVAVFSPLFMLVTLVTCVRTPMAKWKWLWCILTLLGVMQIGVNWTTGAVDLNLLSVTFFNFGFLRLGIYGPFYFSTTIPIGAALFWLWRARRARRG